MKRQLPSQTLEEQFLSPDTRQAPLSETIRLGAQLMLQKAVELEVAEFLGRDHYQRHGDSLLRGYRNGYADKRVQTAEGPIQLKMPQVRNTIDAFESVWLQSLVRRSDKLAALIPQLYVKGMSTRDIEAALTETLEVEGVSKSAVSQLCRALQQDFGRWQERDLWEHQILYLFCDGIYLRLRPDEGKATAVLCACGIRADGKKVLLHLAVGEKESTVCWKSFFDDMKGRGLVDPLLAVIDGNSGLRRAVRESFPGAWVQRCQGHRMRNILCKLPEKARPRLKKLIAKAFRAPSYEAGRQQAQGIIARYEADYPLAMKCLRTDGRPWPAGAGGRNAGHRVAGNSQRRPRLSIPSTYFEQRARRKGRALVMGAACSACWEANFSSIITAGPPGVRGISDPAAMRNP